MFYQIVPRDDQWNRKYGFTSLESVGFFIKSNNGITYFGWLFSDNTVEFFTCEDQVFNNHFALNKEPLEDSRILVPEKPIFRRYPIG